MKCEKCGTELIDGVYKCLECGWLNHDPYTDNDIVPEAEIQDTVKNPAIQAVTKNVSQINPKKILKPLIKVLIAVIVICVVVLVVINLPEKKEEEQSGVQQTTGQYQQSGVITDYGSSPLSEQNAQAQQQIAQQHQNGIDVNSPEYAAYSCEGFTALLNNSFFMTCEMDGTEFEIITRGSDLQMTYEQDGLKLSLMRLSGKMYFVDTDTMTYVELSKALLTMMDMSEEDLELEMDWPTPATPMTFTEVDDNGKKSVCVSYTDSSGVTCNIMITDGKVTRLDSLDDRGNVEASIVMKELTGNIPPNKLTLYGYKPTNIMSFVLNMMNEEALQ